MSEDKGYHKRVEKEADELYERLGALSRFMHTELFDDLTQTNRALLTSQAQYMGMYHNVLCMRIAGFK